jgi:hypothetical protein
MKTQKRVTRPSLERKAPIRAWATLFGAPGGAGGATAGAAGPAKPLASSPGDAIQRGVEFAYRVSDEYLRQGQAMARAVSQPFSQPFTNGPRLGGAADGGLGQLTERMMRYTAELSRMWMDAMRMMPGAAANGERNGVRWPAEPPLGARAAAAPPPSPPVTAVAPRSVALQIDSKLRTRATLDVRGAGRGSVVVEPLALAGGKARLPAAKVDAEDGEGPIVVSVRVPAKQAAGTYVGRVLDGETRAPLGTVTVRVTR